MKLFFRTLKEVSAEFSIVFQTFGVFYLLSILILLFSLILGFNNMYELTSIINYGIYAASIFVLFNFSVGTYWSDRATYRNGKRFRTAVIESVLISFMIGVFSPFYVIAYVPCMLNSIKHFFLRLVNNPVCK